MRFNWLQFKEKWIKRTRKPRAYKSVDEMLNEIKKDAFLEGIWNEIYYTTKHFWELPGDTLTELKWRIQRSKNGWAVCDAWGAYHHIASVIKGTLEYVRDHKHGVPMQCFRKSDPIDKTGNHTDEAMNNAIKRWGKVLDDIIWTFNMIEEIDNHTVCFPYRNTYFTKVEIKKWEKFCEEMNSREDRLSEYNCRIMTRAEFKRYNRGWKLFKEHFFSLWD